MQAPVRHKEEYIFDVAVVFHIHIFAVLGIEYQCYREKKDCHYSLDADENLRHPLLAVISETALGNVERSESRNDQRRDQACDQGHKQDESYVNANV